MLPESLSVLSLRYQNEGRPNPSPQLTITGKRLEKLGFSTGQPVSITAETGVW
ncbi:MAG: type I toxin-antitoxin system SymE family toxin [Ewingella americana]|nr:SymE family type I addiction module toxin [Ewingella americana]MCI1677598.1 type I toxin-antitoxin system SymE family toxin [Ewingella americana]MCI1852713.1 type I toxin-antitoxin system SymE family toxin [Ewingella americana]MCI1861201.1 type I toxin-antitoxin system SymE family toxin [Ewingella americana]MCI2144457.1 type I toxin-antitoxin system SymE family toxin [Ewingella americana]MCI2162720.1 type I toxin-antitoxin system SymE family toxin [Ewingella americana]